MTYEGFARAWPTIQDEEGFAARMNSMPKYVVSTTVQRPEWSNSTVLRDNVAGEVRRLREEVAGDILINGSGHLVRSLMHDDLIDEYRLMVYPIVLGVGQRLFGETDPSLPLRLADVRRAGDCAILILQPLNGAARTKYFDPTVLGP